MDTGLSASSSRNLSTKSDTFNSILLMRGQGGVELEPRHGSLGFKACKTLPPPALGIENHCECPLASRIIIIICHGREWLWAVGVVREAIPDAPSLLHASVAPL